MFFALINRLFLWLPVSLRVLVGAVFGVFAIFVAVALLKAVYNLLQFIFNALGGLLSKVVSLFT